MPALTRARNKILAKLLTRYPRLAKSVAGSWATVVNQDVPWTPLSKPPEQCAVALVTTAGVHHIDQPPFDMHDPDGDPSFRVIDASRPRHELMITHDYYDHRDADRDLNIVFPLDRLRELAREGAIGAVAASHYGFMGHITGRHLDTLRQGTAPEVARRLVADGVDLVILTPG